ncbi:MAG: hypothetical protein ACXWQZ_16540 [Ktedonobacterales bacterium]
MAAATVRDPSAQRDAARRAPMIAPHVTHRKRDLSHAFSIIVALPVAVCQRGAMSKNGFFG